MLKRNNHISSSNEWLMCTPKNEINPKVKFYIQLKKQLSMKLKVARLIYFPFSIIPSYIYWIIRPSIELKNYFSHDICNVSLSNKNSWLRTFSSLSHCGFDNLFCVLQIFLNINFRLKVPRKKKTGRNSLTAVESA